MQRNSLYLIFFTWLILVACQREHQSFELPEKVDFNFHIRPILSNNCYTCHGPDSSSRKADLRLDIEAIAKAPLKNGDYAIHAGKWRKSELISRILSDDPDLQMPPPEMDKQLSEKEIALLKKWIQQGAEWKDYWAFELPEIPREKVFSNLKNPSTKVDYLINKELNYKELVPSEKAEKTALIRRLSYLLIGLPPTPEEVQNFLEDDSNDAYEKIVNRLLASPHYGERWARHWMDLVRYAAYKGHEFDYPILGAWEYRDYLIRAFNEDVPYDLFVKEHLAGDMLENPRIHREKSTNESIHGTAFFTFGEGKHSPVSIRQEEADYIDNMIDVSTKTFQSLTVACARCHDHKFDPIPTTDYYALYGMLESTRFTLIPSNTSVAAAEKVDSIEVLKQELKGLLQTLSEAEAQQENLANSVAVPTLTNYTPPSTSNVIADFRNGSLNNWFSDGWAFCNQNALGEIRFQEKANDAIQLSSGQASSQILGKGIQGALRSPTFTIEKDKLLIRAAGDTAMIRIIVDNFQLIQNPIYGSLQQMITAPEMQDYVFDLSMVKGRKAYIELLPGQSISKEGKLHHFTFPTNAWIEAEYAIAFDGKVPISPKLDDFSIENTAIAFQNWRNNKANPAEIALLNQVINIDKDNPEFHQIKKIKTQIEKLSNTLQDSTFFQGVTEGDAIQSSVFIRGNINTLSEEKIPHRFFTVLEDFSLDFPEQGSGRLAFAEAIVHPDNPLTSRVLVNRIWHHLFGKGIVETVDNFGLQGKPPSHPELLDYLAIQFVEEGWSIKKLIKHIVLTEAFQRKSTISPEVLEKDPENIYLSHYNVRRLEAEAIRDGVLAVSGRLDRTLFGGPFEVYFTDFMKGRGRPRKLGNLDGEGRRSIYQTIRRNFLPPFMLTFDMPAPFSTFGKRNVSNVPAQSLMMMNDPFIHQQAEFWAKKLFAIEMTFEQRVGQIYRSAFSRLPNDKELQQAKGFFEQQQSVYPESEEVDLWKEYCHSIFMRKEFMYLM